MMSKYGRIFKLETGLEFVVKNYKRSAGMMSKVSLLATTMMMITMAVLFFF